MISTIMDDEASNFFENGDDLMNYTGAGDS